MTTATSKSGPPEIRGMLGPKGDSMNWSDAVAGFPNGVPRFESRADCKKFMEDYNTFNGGSNPDYPQLMHIFTMLVSWEQIEKYLLPNIDKARQEYSAPKYQISKDDSNNANDTNVENANVYEQEEAANVRRDIEFRLDTPIHKCTTAVSTMYTLKYLFYHMKCGIYVMIRNGELRIFCPFVNQNYRNTWGDQIQLEGDNSLDTYYSKKAGSYREEHIEKDRFKWWANGNIICNELSRPNEKDTMQFWGDHFLAALRDSLGEACRTRTIPDCEFFINKRDYPQLKFNIPMGIPVEPYGFIFDKDDRDPAQDVALDPDHKFPTYAPIVSFYAAKPDRFTDIPWPSSEDWEAACGLVFPNTFMHKKDKDGNAVFDGNPRDLFTEANFRKFERKWEDNRVATAFFRGTATGGGTTIHNNQRLMVAHYSDVWKNDQEKGGEEPFLDAAIVGWNMRDKKTAESPMTFLRQSDFKFTAGKHHFTPIYEQSKYKYLVYVDGHCAACRYGFMMRLGSVIIKVESRQVAEEMWYFPLLQPYVDHVPVKPDLSDLEEKIRWCRQNDDKCKQIGIAAQKFYDKYVGREPCLDYIEMVCKQIAKRYVKPPDWWHMPPPEREPPKLRKPDTLCYEDRETNKNRFCVRCQKTADDEEMMIAAQKAKYEEEAKNATGKKRSIRSRMLAKAKAKAKAEKAARAAKKAKK